MSVIARLLITLAFLAVCVFWGSPYLAIRFALESLPPLLLGAFRFFIAGVGLYLFGRFRGGSRPAKAEAVACAIAGFLILGVGSGGIVLASRYLPSGQVSLLAATMPIFIVLLQWLKPGGSFPGFRVIIGLFIAVGGLVILLGPSAFGHNVVNLLPVVFSLIAALSAACGALYSRSAKLPLSQPISAGAQMVAAGLTLFGTSFVFGEFQYFYSMHISMKSLLALLYLIVFGSVLAYSAYVWLLDPSLVSTYTYINPIIALLLGCALAGENINQSTWIGAFVILLSVWLITGTKTKTNSQTSSVNRRRNLLLSH